VTLVRTRAHHLLAACAALLLASAGTARADRFEATIAVRPTGGYARIAETGAAAPATVRSTGIAGGVSWGVRNWLDVGGELAASALGEATYGRAMVTVDDSPMAGPLKRMTRIAQLRGVATLRLGVAWVPTVQLAVGPGARQRSSALLRGQSVQGETIYVPDGQEAAVTLDLVAAVRVGLERRLTPSWTVGLSVGASQSFGIGTPDLQLADAAFTLARVWYPGW
jgi:hypothetical protein